MTLTTQQQDCGGIAGSSVQISQAVHSLTRTQVPDEVWAYLKVCIADAIGIAYASGPQAFAKRAQSAVKALGSAGSAAVIGLPGSFSSRDAAMLNGLLIHGLDFDDTHPDSVIHCTASALPAAMAVASEQGSTGDELLLAVLAAIEVDALVGSRAGGKFQQLGFHPTGVVGAFGAVMAASKLMGASAEAMTAAQGLVLSMTSGSMAFLDEGSWTKRLHPGWAAQSALNAAALAIAGFEAPSEAYGGRFGFYALYAQDASLAEGPWAKSLFQRWELPSVSIKPYPVCHFNHASVDAARALKQAHGFSVADIASVEILLNHSQFGVVVEPIERKRRPESEYDAKFSLVYAVATALVLDRLGLNELNPPALTQPDILALIDRSVVRHDDRSIYPVSFSGGVRITLLDGTVLEQFDAVNRGAKERPLGSSDVLEKFVGNTRGTLTEAQAEALWQSIMALDTCTDSREFIRALAQT